MVRMEEAAWPWMPSARGFPSSTVGREGLGPRALVSSNGLEPSGRGMSLVGIGGGMMGGDGLLGGSCSVPVAVVEGEDFREDLFFFLLELAAREEGEVFVGMTTQKLSSSSSVSIRDARRLAVAVERAEAEERLSASDILEGVD